MGILMPCISTWKRVIRQIHVITFLYLHDRCFPIKSLFDSWLNSFICTLSSIHSCHHSMLINCFISRNKSSGFLSVSRYLLIILCSNQSAVHNFTQLMFFGHESKYRVYFSSRFISFSSNDINLAYAQFISFYCFMFLFSMENS